MLTTDLSLDDARTELQVLFGNQYQNKIWTMCCTINNLDPEELEEKTGEITKILDGKLSLLDTMGEVQSSMDKDVEEVQSSTDEDQGIDGEQFTMNQELPEEEEMEERQTLEQRLLAAWVASNYSGTTTQDYRIFAIRCKVSRFSSITKSLV